MHEQKSTVANNLLESFMRFKRLQWPQHPSIGLTHGELMVLSCIRKGSIEAGGGIRVSEISSMLRVASPTITQQINGLETRGYVERRMDQEDRRAVRVHLTAKGEETVQKAWDSFLDRFDGLVEYLGEEDSDELARLLGKVFQYFSEKTARASYSTTDGDTRG